MRYVAWMIAVGLMTLCSTVYGADANDTGGVTVWALGGDGIQEARVGYLGLAPNIELALGGVHRDSQADGDDEWAVRGYGIAHALSMDLVAKLFKSETTLPEGDLYAGGFAEYSKDREGEWAAGYVVGGLLDLGQWDFVTEYQATIGNTDDNDFTVMLGLRRQF